MPIPVTCPGCSARMNAPDAAAGKKVKCPKCQKVLTVPAADADVPDFEVVEDEPVQPAKKPAPRPPAKPQIAADVVVDDDDEEDVRPAKKRAKAVVEDDEDDSRPRKKRRVADEDDEDDRPKKKKKKQAAGGSSLARNIVGGVVLVILLGVVAFVFWDKFGKKEEVASNKPPVGDSPAGPQRPGPQGQGPVPSGPKLPGGNSFPEPKQSGEPNVYTGEGITGGQVVEVEAFVYAPYHGVYASDEWAVSLSDQPLSEGGVPFYWVYLHPNQQPKINDLWTGQKVKIRGRKLPKSATDVVTKFVAAEVVSTGTPPQSVEMTVDQLLKEFRAAPEAAKKKWTARIGVDSYDPPWIKLSGVFDGGGPADVGFTGIQLKGTGADSGKPDRIIIDTPIPIQPLTKNLKPGQQVTVRVRGLNGQDAGQIRFTTGLFPLPK